MLLRLLATYIKNRLYHKAIDRTPYEAWFGEIPDLSNLRVFGSICSRVLSAKELKKSDFRSNECLFMGYSTENVDKVYLYDRVKRKFVYSDDVVFNEHQTLQCGISPGDLDALLERVRGGGPEDSTSEESDDSASENSEPASNGDSLLTMKN